MPQTSVLAEALVSALVALLLAGAVGLVGFALLPRRASPRGARRRIPLAFTIGALALGSALWIAGSLAGTRVALALGGVLVAVSARRFAEFQRALRRAARALAALARHHPLSSACLLAALCLLLPSLVLPASDSDGLRYHLAYPKLFLLTGRVFFYRWDLTGALPQNAEMLYLAALAAGAPLAARMLHALFFAGALAVLALAIHRDRRSRRAALLAPLLFALTPLALAPAGAMFVDHIALFHVATALLLAASPARLLFVGLALGAAVSTKLTVAPAALGIGVYALGRRTRAAPSRWRALAAGLAELALPAALALAPVGIRNLRETGDPVYPVGYALFGREAPGLPRLAQAKVTAFHSSQLGPLGIAWQSAPDVQPDEVAGIQHLAGLLAVAVAIIEPRSRVFLAPVIPYLAVGLIWHPPTRLSMPLFWGLSALEAVALSRVLRRWALAGALLLLAPTAADVLGVAAPPGPSWSLIRGRTSRDEYLLRVVPGYGAARLVNARSPGGGVMALDFPAPFYLDHPWIGEETLNEPVLKTWLDEGLSGAEMLARLRSLGIRYVLVTPGYGGGTPLSLLRVAENAARAGPLLELRRSLRLIGTERGVDVWELPGPWDAPDSY